MLSFKERILPPVAVQALALGDTVPQTRKRDMEKAAEVTQFELSSDTKSISPQRGATDTKERTSSSEGLVKHPNGGAVAWATVFGAWLIQFTSFGYTNAFGVYQDFYVTTYLEESSASRIGWIGSTQLCILLTSGLIVGRFQDMGHFYTLMVSGILLSSFSLFMLSLAHPNAYYQVFLAQGLGSGLGAGLLFVPSIAILTHHFSGARRAALLTFIASGSSFGALIHPIMLNNLFAQIGFQKAVRASAGMCTACNLLALTLMRTRLPGKRAQPLFPMLSSFTRDVPYMTLVLGTALISIGLFYPIFYIQLYATEKGVDPKFVSYIVTILNGFSLFGRLTPTFLVGRLRPAFLSIPATFVCSVLIFAMIALGHTIAGIAVYTALFGFFCGTFFALLPPQFAEFSRNADEIGARIGWGYTFSGLFNLIGNPIEGALLSSRFVWWKPALFAGLCVSIGGCLFALGHYLHWRQKKEAHRASTESDRVGDLE